MSFLIVEKLKLEEIESLSRQIHENANPNRTMNTDSISHLLNERERKMQELMGIFAAEKASFTQLNRRDGQILNGFLGRHAANVHEDEEHVI